jgi:hypothetical protein
MPSIEDPVIISSGYIFLEPRSPYGLHYLVGANAAMLRLMRDNVDNLGLSASEAQFDSTIARTLDLLQNHSIELTVDASYSPDNLTVDADLLLRNLTGHKFPSGYPARRFWLEVSLKHPTTGEVVWHSGALTDDGLSIEGVDEVGLSGFEPHYTMITSEDEVQIYEMVIADVSGSPTNVLERAATTLKDNRLPPLGFSTEHPVYDTTAVVGAEVESDMLFGDFNRDADGEQGTGADQIRYAMSLPANWPVDVTPEVEVKVWYQAMPPRWVADMFDVEADAIADFEALYWDYAAPDLVTSQAVSPVNLAVQLPASHDEMSIFPNPVRRGQILQLSVGHVGAEQAQECVWRDAQGKILRRQMLTAGNSQLQIPEDWSAGVYFLQLSGRPLQRVLVQ